MKESPTHYVERRASDCHCRKLGCDSRGPDSRGLLPDRHVVLVNFAKYICQRVLQAHVHPADVLEDLLRPFEPVPNSELIPSVRGRVHEVLYYVELVREQHELGLTREPVHARQHLLRTAGAQGRCCPRSTL